MRRGPCVSGPFLRPVHVLKQAALTVHLIRLAVTIWDSPCRQLRAVLAEQGQGFASLGFQPVALGFDRRSETQPEAPFRGDQSFLMDGSQALRFVDRAPRTASTAVRGDI